METSVSKLQGTSQGTFQMLASQSTFKKVTHERTGPGPVADISDQEFVIVYDVDEYR